VEWEWVSFSDENEVHATLLELLNPPAWQRDAACKEHPELNLPRARRINREGEDHLFGVPVSP